MRAYLSKPFWLPFAKHSADFERRGVKRVSVPYAGMMAAAGDSPLVKLRKAYQEIREPSAFPYQPSGERTAVAAARADTSLTRKEREEVDLIDAKIDLRAAGEEGEVPDPKLLTSAQKKLEAFLKTARSPEYMSEARGWLGRIFYLQGNRAGAGKIYLDELNRGGSNLSRETLLNSLQMTYGYDGGAALLEDLEEYFDTPEHAAFAIQLVTNPHSGPMGRDPYERRSRFPRPKSQAAAYARIRSLIEKHAGLFGSGPGAAALTLLSMRTAMRMGDPATAEKIATEVPDRAPVRREPDFEWMLGSAHVLTGRTADAEAPLVALFRSAKASRSQKAAAAYGLCGVYGQIGKPEEQLRYALWTSTHAPADMPWNPDSNVTDLSIYWAPSGWDLNELLEFEVPLESLQSFIAANPKVEGLRSVQYALAVRLTRENRYKEAAEIYRAIHALRRAPRMAELAALWEAANAPGVSGAAKLEAQYDLASFIAAHPDGIYFNDNLWHGLQRYAFQAEEEARLNRDQREALIAGERDLKDSQEERWRAYQILQEAIAASSPGPFRAKAIKLALHCIRGINTERFEHEEEIRHADLELSRKLHTM